MKILGMAALVFVAAMLGCGRSSPSPMLLTGTFRSQEPVTKGRNPPLFFQFEFSADGRALFCTVEASGKKIAVPPRTGFTLTGKKITFPWIGPADPNLLYDPPTLIFENQDRLRFDGDKRVLFRVKEPNPLQPTPGSVTPRAAETVPR